MTQCVSFPGDVLLQKRLHYYVPLLSSVSQMSKRDHFKRKVYKCTWHFPSVLLPFLFNLMQMHFHVISLFIGELWKTPLFPRLAASGSCLFSTIPATTLSKLHMTPFTFQWWPTLETWRLGSRKCQGLGEICCFAPRSLQATPASKELLNSFFVSANFSKTLAAAALSE